jgi:prepilin-type N-terminal cleavage/methylation domain-containing protein
MEPPSHKGIHTKKHQESRRGFSLVEILIVISIIGIISAIAIPFMGYIGDAANTSKAKQNAHNTAGVSAALSAAGVEHVLPDSMGGSEATTRLLRRGIVVPDGPLQGATFGIPNLTSEEVAPAAVYLEILLMESVLRMIYNNGA